jgi:hypothetical protein
MILTSIVKSLLLANAVFALFAVYFLPWLLFATDRYPDLVPTLHVIREEFMAVQRKTSVVLADRGFFELTFWSV